jgi:hypothetical protein
MPLQLRDGLHWCECEGRAVFLDTRADRYFCLPQEANEAFLRTAGNRAGSADEAKLDMLCARGMLIPASGSVTLRPAPSLELPTRDLIDERAPPAKPGLIVRMLLAEFAAAWALRRRPFHAVLERARLCTKARAKKAWSAEQIAAAAAAAALITRSHDRCLVRALAVHSLLGKMGAGSKLVLGVVAHPFTAHCWVQLGSAVIVGGYEQARLYTPILVQE